MLNYTYGIFPVALKKNSPIFVERFYEFLEDVWLFLKGFGFWYFLKYEADIREFNIRWEIHPDKNWKESVLNLMKKKSEAKIERRIL